MKAETATRKQEELVKFHENSKKHLQQEIENFREEAKKQRKIFAMSNGVLFPQKREND
jgi:hypothetical protein